MHDCTQSQTNGSIDIDGASPITRLSNLMADIYRTLAILTGSSHATKYPSFNFCEYPIGTVLHLARTLLEIILTSHCLSIYPRHDWSIKA